MLENQTRHIHRPLMVRDHHGQKINIGIARISRRMHVGHHFFHADIHFPGEALERLAIVSPHLRPVMHVRSGMLGMRRTQPPERQEARRDHAFHAVWPRYPGRT